MKLLLLLTPFAFA